MNSIRRQTWFQTFSLPAGDRKNQSIAWIVGRCPRRHKARTKHKSLYEIAGDVEQWQRWVKTSLPKASEGNRSNYRKLAQSLRGGKAKAKLIPDPTDRQALNYRLCRCCLHSPFKFLRKSASQDRWVYGKRNNFAKLWIIWVFNFWWILANARADEPTTMHSGRRLPHWNTLTARLEPTRTQSPGLWQAIVRQRGVAWQWSVGRGDPFSSNWLSGNSWRALEWRPTRHVRLWVIWRSTRLALFTSHSLAPFFAAVGVLWLLPEASLTSVAWKCF